MQDVNSRVQQPVRFERPIARTAAAIAALSLLSWVFTTLGVPDFRADALVSAVLKLTVLTLVPLAVACALGWWAWRGWALPRQPRWMTGVSWGVGAGFVWAFGGTLLLIMWSVLVRGEEAGNLVGLIPFLTSPLAFIGGFIYGFLRSS